MIQLPQSIFDLYNSAASDMISSNFGVNCKLIYPPLKQFCPNCVYDPIGKKSANKYVDGGPAPFNFGVCPLCGGVGYAEQEQFDTVKMRVQFNPKYFIKVAELVNIDESAAQVIGFRSDIHKFRNANRIIIQSDKPDWESRVFSRIGNYVPFGLGPEKPFFICFLKRAG